MKLLVSVEAPYYWANYDPKKRRTTDSGEVRSLAELSSRIPKAASAVIGVAPAEHIAMRSVDIPSKRRANVEAAVPYALEEGLSEDVDSLHFSVMDWAPGKLAHVSVISRAQLNNWLAEFKDAGLRLDAIIPESKLVPMHSDSAVTIARTGPNRLLVREGAHAMMAMDDESFEYWWQDAADRDQPIAVNDRQLAHELAARGGQQLSQWDIGRDFRAWLSHQSLQDIEHASLLRGDYEPEHLKPSTRGLQLAGVIAVFSFLVLSASNWWEIQRLEAELERNNRDIRNLFSQSFPNEEYLDAPRRQVASLLALDESDGDDHLFQYMLDIAAESVPNHNASFDEVNFSEGALQIGVTVPSFAELDKLTAEMGKRTGVQARLISSGSRANKVTGQIRLTRG